MTMDNLGGLLGGDTEEKLTSEQAEALRLRLEQAVRKHLKEWAEPNFRIGQVNFMVQKFLPRDGFRVLELLRTAIGPRLGQADSSLTGVVGALLSIPTSDMERLQDTLFQRVWFSSGGGDRANFGDNIDEGMQELEAMHLYEITGRCIVVNFSVSMEGALSHILSAIRNLASQPTETSTPSSPSP